MKKNKKLSQNSSLLTASKNEASLQSKVFTEAPKPDSIALELEDANVLRANEQKVLQAKLRIADIELTISAFNSEKNELFNLIKSEHEEFVNNARKFAVKNGIDPDGEPSKEQWNLDTSTMVFNKLK